MPRGDRTGPMGMGPMSGRGAGTCANNQAPGFMNRFFGRGAGAGFRRNQRGGRDGFAWRNLFRNIGYRGSNQAAASFGRRAGRSGGMRDPDGDPGRTGPDPEMEKQAVVNRVNLLQSQLARLQQRLRELE